MGSAMGNTMGTAMGAGLWSLAVLSRDRAGIRKKELLRTAGAGMSSCGGCCGGTRRIYRSAEASGMFRFSMLSLASGEPSRTSHAALQSAASRMPRHATSAQESTDQSTQERFSPLS